MASKIKLKQIVPLPTGSNITYTGDAPPVLVQIDVVENELIVDYLALLQPSLSDGELRIEVL